MSPAQAQAIPLSTRGGPGCSPAFPILGAAVLLVAILADAGTLYLPTSAARAIQIASIEKA